MKVNEDFSRRTKLQDVGRWYVTRFVKEVAKQLPGGSSILDAGAGECVYKPFFQHCDYKAIDLAIGEDKWNYANLDYVGPLHHMPIESERFDAVLCTQVLEHLEWPRESVKEMWRILKPGGKLFLTVPMCQAEHQIPYDFFRYTSYGLRSICGHAGFSEITIEPFGGLWTRWAYELPRATSIFPSAGFNSGSLNFLGLSFLPLKILILLPLRIMQALFLFLERFDKVKNDPFGWSVVAVK